MSLSLFAFTGSDHDVLPPSHAITDTDSFNTQNRICTGSHWSQGKLIPNAYYIYPLSLPVLYICVFPFCTTLPALSGSPLPLNICLPAIIK